MTNALTDLTSYLLGERSELRALIEAIAGATEEGERERAAVEYLLVLASARSAARGQPPEARAMAQIRSQYCRTFSRDDSEHARILKELYAALESGSYGAVATALKLLGLYHRKKANFRVARGSFAVSVEVSKLLDDPVEQLNALFWLGVVERCLGDLDAAERVHREQLEMARAVGQRGQAVLAQENLGLVALRRGQLKEARRRVTRALSEAQELQDRELEGYCYHALMLVEMTAARPGEAAVCGWEAYRRYESTDQRMRALQDCGLILYESGLLEAAQAAFEIVVERSNDAAPRIHARIGLADVAAALGERERFEAIGRDLLAEDTLNDLPYELINVQRTLGLGYATFGEIQTARRHLESSLALAESKGFGAEAAEIKERLAGLPAQVPAFMPVRPSQGEHARLEAVSQSVVAERARVSA